MAPEQIDHPSDVDHRADIYALGVMLYQLVVGDLNAVFAPGWDRDIDDPLLERAVQTGQDWRTIAERETALFREDMEALRVLPPRDYIGAVESVNEVVELVEKFVASGAAYVVDDPETRQIVMFIEGIRRPEAFMAAAGRRGGQHRRDDVQALQSQHLLDQIGGLQRGVGQFMRMLHPRDVFTVSRRTAVAPPLVGAVGPDVWRRIRAAAASGTRADATGAACSAARTSGRPTRRAPGCSCPSSGR